MKCRHGFQEIGLVVILIALLDINVLDKLAEQVDPTKTLLYLVDWTKDGHDINYPDYTPKTGFGGVCQSCTSTWISG